MRRLAVLSLHTSPLAQPGSGDSGGMNVYVRELVSALAQAGIDCTTYVRRWATDLPDEVFVEPGFRVVHVDAGPPELPKEALPAVVDRFADRRHRSPTATPAVPTSCTPTTGCPGVAGHRIKHELELPLVTTFHTLARVKAENGDAEPERRVRAEGEVIGCADAICVSCTEEEQQFRRLYGDPARPSRDRCPGRRARLLLARRQGRGPPRSRARR